ncbi:hypothetical protein DKP78_15875 [Enterococcus faecium]|nr:hypothetical protein DKP78_15875 [Enterococcus faecium]
MSSPKGGGLSVSKEDEQGERVFRVASTRSGSPRQLAGRAGFGDLSIRGCVLGGGLGLAVGLVVEVGFAEEP